MSGKSEQKQDHGISNMSICEVEVVVKKLEADNMQLRRELLSARQKLEDAENTISDRENTISDRDLTVKGLQEKLKKCKVEMVKMVQTTLDLSEAFQRGQCTAVDSALMLVFDECGAPGPGPIPSSPAQQQKQNPQQQQLQLQRSGPPPQSMEQQQQPPSGPGGWQDNNHVMSNRGGFNGNGNSPSHGGGRPQPQPHFNGGGGYVVNPLHAMRHGHGHNMNPCEGGGGNPNRFVEMQGRFPVPNPWPPFPDAAAQQQFVYGHRRAQMQLARRGRGVPPPFRYNGSPYHEEWRSRHHNGGGMAENNGECGNGNPSMVYIKQEPIDPTPSNDDGGSIFPF